MKFARFILSVNYNIWKLIYNNTIQIKSRLNVVINLSLVVIIFIYCYDTFKTIFIDSNLYNIMYSPFALVNFLVLSTILALRIYLTYDQQTLNQVVVFSEIKELKEYWLFKDYRFLANTFQFGVDISPKSLDINKIKLKQQVASDKKNLTLDLCVNKIEFVDEFNFTLKTFDSEGTRISDILCGRKDINIDWTIKSLNKKTGLQNLILLLDYLSENDIYELEGQDKKMFINWICYSFTFFGERPREKSIAQAIKRLKNLYENDNYKYKLKKANFLKYVNFQN